MKNSKPSLPRRLRKRHWVAAAVALSSSSVFAVKRPDPVVLTLDGHHYVSYATVEFDPAEHLVLAPDARMSNCVPQPDDGVEPGTFDLVYSEAGDLVAIDTIALHFSPTQLVMTTAGGNVVCEGEALGWETGIDRIYRDEFDSD